MICLRQRSPNASQVKRRKIGRGGALGQKLHSSESTRSQSIVSGHQFPSPFSKNRSMHLEFYEGEVKLPIFNKYILHATQFED